MNNYAPILIPTLNRFEHLRRCLGSLLLCKESAETDIYVALDYPSKPQHWDGYNKIKYLLSNLKGFKSVTVVERGYNFGAYNNLSDAIEMVFQMHEEIIISEDDNEFSPNFLSYVNYGLQTYKDIKNIFAVCGYNYPVKMPHELNMNIYLWRGFSAWGCGIWKDKWKEITFDINDVRTFLKKNDALKKLDQYAGNYLPSLLEISRTNYITCDSFISMHLIQNHMYSLFPLISKVKNYGHDGSGVNGGLLNDSIYLKQEIDRNEFFIPFVQKNDVVEVVEISAILKSHFKLKFHTWVYSRINYLKFMWHYSYNFDKAKINKKDDNKKA